MAQSVLEVVFDLITVEADDLSPHCRTTYLSTTVRVAATAYQVDAGQPDRRTF